MTVCSRLISAWRRLAWFCATCALAFSSWAWATLSWASAEVTAAAWASLLGHGRIVLGHGGIGLHLRGVEVGLGDELSLAELLLAAEVAPAVDHRHLRLDGLGVSRGERGPGIGQIGAGLLDRRLLVRDGGLGGVDAAPWPG